MYKKFAFPAGLAAVAVVAAACGGGSASEAATETAADQPAAAVVVDNAVTEPGALTLDYTAFIAGAVQPSGLGVNAGNSLAAIVTDFERVLVVDLETQEPTIEFGVGRNELPRQGATEAVAFLDDERLAVLYTDDRTIGVFGLDGTLLEELTVDTAGTVDGALTVIDDHMIVVSRGADVANLLRIDPMTGEVTEVRLDGPAEPFEGLSPAGDGDGVIAVTGDGDVYQLDLQDGTAIAAGTVAEVDDPSGVEVFFDGAEGEVQIGVTDDADANSEPSPLRLYLA